MLFTDQNFETEVLKSSVPVLVDFFAVWCGPCRMQGPVIEELDKELENQPVKIGKCDVDASPETSAKYDVMSVPTLIIFQNGEPVDTMIGLQSKKSLAEKLEKLIKE